MTIREKFNQYMTDQKIRQHVENHKTFYISLGTGVAFAGITALIMRGVASQPIRVGNVADAAGAGNVAVAGKKVVMNNVSFISANRQGSPSWVTRCLETNEVFTSQRKAALAMGIPQSELSQHLNGIRDTADGRHFERICLAG